MPPALPLITLLTDFGDRDSFVASMKGVILTINPHVTIVDLSHRIAPHAIDEAAYLLHSCYRRFPEGTVHVSVVDPGVGTSRRPLVVRSGGYYFLAPDNGLLSYVFDEEREIEVREIENAQYRLESPGRTFDGRDLFAPAAAWLTKRQPLVSFGKVVTDPVRFSIEKPAWQGSRLVGRIVSIDRFGNLISNLTSNVLEEASARRSPTPISMHVGSWPIERLVTSYSDGSTDRPCALINSHGRLEIFLKEKSAAQALDVAVGSLVSIA